MGSIRSVATFALFLLTAAGCYPAPDTAPQSVAVRTVEVIELQRESVVDSERLIGRIEPWREVTLYFEVPGVVESVLVEEGERVESGQPIAKLTPIDFQLAASRASAQRDAARAKLDLLVAGTRQEDLEAAVADHERAKVLAAFWVRELTRNEELVEKGAVTPSVFEQVRREHDASQQEELVTKARLARAVAGARKEEINAAQAEALALEHDAELAARQLEKATLTAPFGGRVERRLLDEGAYVNVFPAGGVPVMHLVDLGTVDAVIAVPEVSLPRLADTTSVEIVSAMNPSIRTQGETVSLGQVADPASGTYELRVRFPNPDGNFTGGMVVTATITGPTTREVLRVPVSSVLHAYGQQPYVLLLGGDDSVVARQVTLGAMLGERVEIIQGLSDGEQLIVRGQHQVVEGDRVQHRPATAPSDSIQSRPTP